ncbi:MAG: DUF134 domain-containing protein [Candidatus Dojkabacteria bacterium]
MRPRLRRRLGIQFRDTYFKPRGIPIRELNEINITDEELETLRLRFIENIDQEQAARMMGISQSQYQRDLSSVMNKITQALINGYAISITKREETGKKISSQH